MTSVCYKFSCNWYSQEKHLESADSKCKGTPLWVGISSPWHPPSHFCEKSLCFPSWAVWDLAAPLSPQCCAGPVWVRGCNQRIAPCKGETSGSLGLLGTPGLSPWSPDGNASNQGHLGTIFSTVVPDFPASAISIRLNCSALFQPSHLPNMM